MSKAPIIPLHLSDVLNACSLATLGGHATKATREDIIRSLRWHDSHHALTTHGETVREKRRTILRNALAATEDQPLPRKGGRL